MATPVMLRESAAEAEFKDIPALCVGDCIGEAGSSEGARGIS
ncbi:hypothetical protein OK016_29380 [Vibrio chagasii]|nr:hypothetical protein [Vibrio chagasii]